MDALFGVTCAGTFLLTSYSSVSPVLNCFGGYIGNREDIFGLDEMKENILAITGVVAIMLLLALFDMPYNYYTVLRFAVFIVSMVVIYTALPLEKHWLTIVFSLIAILFNPFIKISFDREVWALVDVAVGLMFVFGGYIINKENKTKKTRMARK